MMVDTIISGILTFYPFFLLVGAFIAVIARGYHHMAIPLLLIVGLVGYRLYHREHAHFMNAVRYGELEKVRSYLTWYANPNYSNNGVTPLMIASMEGHAEVVKLLLSFGADTSTTYHDLTPIEIATLSGQSDIARLLERKPA